MYMHFPLWTTRTFMFDTVCEEENNKRLPFVLSRRALGAMKLTFGNISGVLCLVFLCTVGAAPISKSTLTCRAMLENRKECFDRSSQDMLLPAVTQRDSVSNEKATFREDVPRNTIIGSRATRRAMPREDSRIQKPMHLNAPCNSPGICSTSGFIDSSFSTSSQMPSNVRLQHSEISAEEHRTLEYAERKRLGIRSRYLHVPSNQPRYDSRVAVPGE